MKSRRIVLVLLGCTLMYGAMMGILYNCAGVVISSIIDTEGFTSSSVSGFYTMRAFVSAIAVIITAKLLPKYNIKLLIIAVGLLSSLSYFLMFFYTEPWQWTVSGVLSGIGASSAALLPTTVIRAWFTKKRGTVIGLVTMTSGLFGALFNPVVSGMIESYGWRNSVMMIAIAASTIVVISALLIVRRPSDVGDIPYGGEEIVSLGSEPAAAPTTKAPINVKLCIFVFFTVSAAGMCVQATSYIPQYSSSLGYPLAVGASLTSMIMIGNLSAKFLFGVVSDRIGVWKSIQIFHSLIGVAFVIFIFLGDSLVMMHVASLLLGIAYITGVGMPLVCVDLYEPQQFEVQYSRTTMINSLAATLVPYMLSYIYDTTDSFKPAFAVFIVLLTISILLITQKNKIAMAAKNTGRC